MESYYNDDEYTSDGESKEEIIGHCEDCCAKNVPIEMVPACASDDGCCNKWVCEDNGCGFMCRFCHYLLPSMYIADGSVDPIDTVYSKTNENLIILPDLEGKLPKWLYKVGDKEYLVCSDCLTPMNLKISPKLIEWNGLTNAVSAQRYG